MNDRLDTLTEHSFKLNQRVNDLETNVLLIGGLCVAVTLYMFVKDRKSV